MDRLARIQRISAGCRYLLLGAAVLLAGAIVIALLSPDQARITIGEGGFLELWHGGSASRMTLGAIMFPVALTLLVGLYWLQRLFGEYQQGHFFTDDSMRCYVWLVWLKAFSFVYLLVLPALLSLAAAAPEIPTVSIDAGSLVELLLLLLIVNLLKAAQQINEENKGFV